MRSRGPTRRTPNQKGFEKRVEGKGIKEVVVNEELKKITRQVRRD